MALYLKFSYKICKHSKQLSRGDFPRVFSEILYSGLEFLHRVGVKSKQALYLIRGLGYKVPHDILELVIYT